MEIRKAEIKDLSLVVRLKMDILLTFTVFLKKEEYEKYDAYIATVNDDQALREKTAKLWSELNNGLILPEHINYEGCRKNGMKTFFCDGLCEIRKCALNKGVETCGDCLNLETCPTKGEIISNNPSVLKKFEKIKH